MCFSPTSPDPLPPASSALRVCPDQNATLLSTQLTLLLQPFSTPPPHVQETAEGQQTNRFLCQLPSSAFPARPLTHSVSGCAGSVGGPFSGPSVCTYWSLCPRAGEPCSRTQEEGERWVLPLPPAPPGGARALCLPTVLNNNAK